MPRRILNGRVVEDAQGVSPTDRKASGCKRVPTMGSAITCLEAQGDASPAVAVPRGEGRRLIRS